jgi:hypothetical protein
MTHEACVVRGGVGNGRVEWLRLVNGGHLYIGRRMWFR